MRRESFYPDVKTGPRWPVQEELGRRSTYCPSGIRRKGGVTFIRAFMWNAGTCRFNVKGEIQIGNPYENESTDVKNRGGTTRSSVEISVMEMERRSRVIRYDWMNQPLFYVGGIH